MGDPRSFIEHKRKNAGNRPAGERLTDFAEVEQTLNSHDRLIQASRCMDCGVPFCHWACTTHSRIPEWQDAMFCERWDEAIDILQDTNDLPEITGRICPALCEKSCVLAISDEPVTIRENEAALAEKAFDLGLMQPKPPRITTGKKVAVIGSGPAGITVANRLNQEGHQVTVFEKDEMPGGLLTYGIPDFKLNKRVVSRRIELLEKEGIRFETNVYAGKDITARELTGKYDAICLAVGAREPRDLQVPGRELTGIWFAMDFLSRQNDIIAGKTFSGRQRISAKGKHVVVIGGGDTGSDCVGTANRQGARSVTQVEILPKPPEKRPADNPWPYWPQTLRTSSSHEEGCTRLWSLQATRIKGANGQVREIELTRLDWNRRTKKGAPMDTGEKTSLKADMILLAMGFVHPVKDKLLKDLNIRLHQRGYIDTETLDRKIFIAGDAATGPSLVVKAIDSGQKTAWKMNEYLNSLSKDKR
ncbi:MAG: glutamate synthase subunit beta [Chlorobi bacterium]|nr:glutamate synthase subunit beta [Chlorobiota bacterium]